MDNLNAEIRRYGLSNADLRRALGCSEKTVRNKLSGTTDFTINEAILLRDTFFPGMRLEYLYKQSKKG